MKTRTSMNPAVAAEVLCEALKHAATAYGDAAERAAVAVETDGQGGVTASSVRALDTWHEAVLRHEHALALLVAARSSIATAIAPPKRGVAPSTGTR